MAHTTTPTIHIKSSTHNTDKLVYIKSNNTPIKTILQKKITTKNNLWNEPHKNGKQKSTKNYATWTSDCDGKKTLIQSNAMNQLMKTEPTPQTNKTSQNYQTKTTDDSTQHGGQLVLVG